MQLTPWKPCPEGVETLGAHPAPQGALRDPGLWDATPFGVNATREAAPREIRQHVVAEGDTLFSLAVHYYGAADNFVAICRANRDVLTTPDRLEPGTVLAFPDLGEPAD